MKECNCGNYKPYIETMETGVIHAPSMPFNSCVNCYGENMKEITLYREDNGQYSTSEAKQDDVSGVYVQKEHLTDLQAENDELRANNESIRKAFDKTLELACQEYSCSENFYEYAKEKLEQSPAQSLADIKAEAVRKAAEVIKADVLANETYYTVVAGKPLIPTSKIEDYANKLKEGE